MARSPGGGLFCSRDIGPIVPRSERHSSLSIRNRRGDARDRFDRRVVGAFSSLETAVMPPLSAPAHFTIRDVGGRLAGVRE
jgi:hypothetical protein